MVRNFKATTRASRQTNSRKVAKSFRSRPKEVKMDDRGRYYIVSITSKIWQPLEPDHFFSTRQKVGQTPSLSSSRTFLNFFVSICFVSFCYFIHAFPVIFTVIVDTSSASTHFIYYLHTSFTVKIQLKIGGILHPLRKILQILHLRL